MPLPTIVEMMPLELILRTLFELSVRNTLPARSTIIPPDKFKEVDVARTPSAEIPKLPLPAMVEIIPFLEILLTRYAFISVI